MITVEQFSASTITAASATGVLASLTQPDPTNSPTLHVYAHAVGDGIPHCQDNLKLMHH